MSNLLEKASILTTPTAYNNGKLLSVKPAPSLGSELVINGDFATDSDWIKGSGWSISGGKANANTSGSFINLTQENVFEVGKNYVISFNITAYTQGDVRLTQAGIDISGSKSALGAYTHSHYATNSDLRLIMQGLNSFIGSIDNVSVKEVIDADLDFTRGSTATRVNSSGLIEDVASGLPRIDYTDGVGSILLEPQSTNIVPYSEDFSDSSWFKGNTSVIADQEVSPSGIQDADKITFLAVPNANIQLTSAASTTIGQDYTYSVYAKADTNVNNVNFGVGIEGDVDLAITDEWQRFSVTFNATSTSTVTSFVTRNSVLSNIYLWGAQLEQQSYATSIIPTSGTVQTRLAEAASNAGSSDLINSSEGVLYFEASTLLNGGRYMTISINDGSSSNHISFLYRIQENQVWMQTSGSGTATNINIYDVVQNINNKIALSYSANGIKLFINGLLKGSISINALPIGLNSVEFNNGAQGEKFYGKTKCVAVFKEALTDAELTCLTTI